jgi:hypothetical protein
MTDTLTGVVYQGDPRAQDDVNPEFTHAGEMTPGQETPAGYPTSADGASGAFNLAPALYGDARLPVVAGEPVTLAMLARRVAGLAPAKGTCHVCGARLAGRRRRYCTDAHAAIGRWLYDREALFCQLPECGALLGPGRVRYCSREHSRAAYFAARRVARKADGGGEMLRTAARLVRSTGGDAKLADPETFAVIWGLQLDLESAAVAAIDGMRAKGFTWEEIGAAVGVTKNAASQWRKRRAGSHPYPPETPELEA